jgi:membrane associated rhomboid family serine protease
MFAIWMFGRILESTWGDKRFLIYYIITGLGAMVLYSIVQQIQISVLEAKMTIEQIQHVASDASDKGYECYKEIVELSKSGKGLNEYGYSLYGIKGAEMKGLLSLYYSPVLGASGALFGILLAFGMLFPSTRLRVFAAFLILISFEMIFSIPLPIFNIFIILLIISRIDAKLNYYIWYTIPIQAKYFVLAYGLLELFLSFMNTNDGIAHFAHLGGMLFGFLLLIYWKKKGNIHF